MIGAPVIVALIITDAAFGVVSRVVPQMNIFAVGFPAKMIVGLTLLGASLPFVSGFVADELQLSVAAGAARAPGGLARWPTTRPRRQHQEAGRRAQEGPGRPSTGHQRRRVLLGRLLALSASGPKTMEQMKLAMVQVISLMRRPQVVNQRGHR